MKKDFFYKAIQLVKANNCVAASFNQKITPFLLLEKTFLTKRAHASLKMTVLTVLFEGIYQACTCPDLKKNLLKLRFKRWEANHGLPTLYFLLTYNTLIEKNIPSIN